MPDDTNTHTYRSRPMPTYDEVRRRVMSPDAANKDADSGTKTSTYREMSPGEAKKAKDAAKLEADREPGNAKNGIVDSYDEIRRKHLGK